MLTQKQEMMAAIAFSGIGSVGYGTVGYTTQWQPAGNSVVYTTGSIPMRSCMANNAGGSTHFVVVSTLQTTQYSRELTTKVIQRDVGPTEATFPSGAGLVDWLHAK